MTFINLKTKSVKKILYALLIVILISCSTNENEKNYLKNKSLKADTAINQKTDTTNLLNTADADFATYYIVVTDTSFDYYFLNKKMFNIHQKYNIEIDSMDRSYNKNKQLIALPNSYDDEMYAGEYYPRRFPSEYLSLEYLNFYQKNSGEKTIALVAGIYETEHKADSALSILKKTVLQAFKIKANIYVGCMH